jgi:hypothetical protein
MKSGVYCLSMTPSLCVGKFFVPMGWFWIDRRQLRNAGGACAA